MNNRIISCCGVVCSECNYYPQDCTGCPTIKGKPFWTKYTGQEICQRYKCCILEKKLGHCGKCEKLPCEKWFSVPNPTVTPEEAERGLQAQIKFLRDLP